MALIKEAPPPPNVYSTKQVDEKQLRKLNQ